MFKYINQHKGRGVSMVMQKTTKIQALREILGPRLVTPEQVTTPPGITTGWSALDNFVLWQGFPKGALSLLLQETSGATTLWLKSASHVTRQGQWVAWMNSSESDLTPWCLRQHNVNLQRFLTISAPRDERQLLWMLQELLSLSLVEMIGCDIGAYQLRAHHLLKLKKLATQYATALVFITPTPRPAVRSFFALDLSVHQKHITIHRALHRPTPHILERKDLYADTLSLLATGQRTLCG